MATVFSKIISGEIPCHKIAEDDKYLAFLDINPLKEGHTLVIPKKEQDYIFDLSDSELAELMTFAKKVAIALKKTINCTRIGVSVIGLEVAHTHIHLIPMNNVSDMNFALPKLSLSDEALSSISNRVNNNFKEN